MYDKRPQSYADMFQPKVIQEMRDEIIRLKIERNHAS